MPSDIPPEVQRHIALLSQRSALERQKAAMMLGRLHHPAAVDPLIDLLWLEQDKVVRSNAIQALEYIRDDRAVQPLLQMLRSEFEPIRARHMLRVAIKLAGPSIAPTLVQMLNTHKSAAIQREIVDLLGEIRYVDALFPLLDILQSLDYQEAYHNQELRTAVLRVLGLLQDHRAVEPLISLLESGRARQHEILDALGRIGDRRALPHVKHYLLHAPDLMTRSAAKRAYTALVDASDLPDLLDMLTVDELELRLLAVQILGLLGDARAVPRLVGVMHDPQAGIDKRGDGDANVRLRMAVMRALADIGDRAAIPDLRRYFWMREAWRAIRTIKNDDSTSDNGNHRFWGAL